MTAPLLTTNLPFPKRQGKVRDCYDLGEYLLIISTDRISAFDYILPNGIPDKGRVLTQLSRFWFSSLGVKHHLVATDLPAEIQKLDPSGLLEDRTMLVKKLRSFLLNVWCAATSKVQDGVTTSRRGRFAMLHYPLD